MGIERTISKLVLAGALAGLLGACSSSGSSSSSANVKVVINELQPSNQTTVFDENQEADDWIEIYNPGTEAADLEGFYVSDSASNVFKHELLAGVLVPAGGFLLLWADDDVGQGPAHLSFKLSSSGENVQIADPDGKVLDSTSFLAITTTTQDSWARHPDGTGAFSWCSTPTPLTTNGDACAGATE